jgi:HPt (histidine-containing phosphotransfer) domain-containing protein
MDVQMPEVDGLEATRRIREQETQGRVPIVAMTAHALKGDRERCIEAGMDDYVSKPIAADKLQAVIRRLCPAPAAAPAMTAFPAPRVSPAGPPADPAPPPAPIDRKALLASFDNDAQLMAEVAALFVEDAPGLLAAMGQAIDTGDSQAVMQAAHNLKGMLRSFQTEGPAQTALSLEQMGKAGRLDGAKALFDSLESDVHLLSRTLERMTDDAKGH